MTYCSFLWVYVVSVLLWTMIIVYTDSCPGPAPSAPTPPPPALPPIARPLPKKTEPLFDQDNTTTPRVQITLNAAIQKEWNNWKTDFFKQLEKSKKLRPFINGRGSGPSRNKWKVRPAWSGGPSGPGGDLAGYGSYGNGYTYMRSYGYGDFDSDAGVYGSEPTFPNNWKHLGPGKSSSTPPARATVPGDIGKPPMCFEDIVYGDCSGSFTRWGYYVPAKHCGEFSYSGCGGNTNNFYTKAECENACAKPVVSACTWLYRRGMCEGDNDDYPKFR